MKRPLIVAGLIAVVGAAGWAQGAAGIGSGQWLHDAWTEYERSTAGAGPTSRAPGDILKTAIESGLFVGFVVGVSSAVNDGSIQLLEIPASVTTQQVLTIVGRYLDDHPEKWSLPAQILVRNP